MFFQGDHDNHLNSRFILSHHLLSRSRRALVDVLKNDVESRLEVFVSIQVRPSLGQSGLDTELGLFRQDAVHLLPSTVAEGFLKYGKDVRDGVNVEYERRVGVHRHRI